MPPKLIQKILTKEYINTSELLLESWLIEAEGSCCHFKCHYTTMAAILAAAYPAKSPHMYLQTNQ